MKTLYKVTAPAHIYEPQYVRGPIYKVFDTHTDALKTIKRIKKVLQLQEKDGTTDAEDKFREMVYDLMNCNGDCVFTGSPKLTVITEETINV